MAAKGFRTAKWTKAVRTKVLVLTAMCPLVVDHVAQFRRLDLAIEAFEKLVSAASLVIKDVLLDKTHVASVQTIAVADPLFDSFLQRLLQASLQFIIPDKLSGQLLVIIIVLHLNQWLGDS